MNEVSTNNVLQQLRELAKENGENFFGEDELPENFERVLSGDWIDDYKYSCLQTVYKDKNTGKFYGIYNSRSGSYYSDYYYSEAEVEEVKPVEVVKTIYKVVEGASE